MEIEARIKKMKDILITLIEFIDASDNPEAEFQALNDKLKEHKILHNDEEVQLLFQLILKIASNHRRLPDFFDKLDQIMQILIQTKPSPISKFIPDFQNYNKLIIFFLLEKGFVIPDQSFLDQYLQRKQTIETFSNNPLKNFQSDYFYYLYPIMKEFIEEKMQEQIEKEIFQLFDVDIQKFAEKCQIGENDSYICSLIRKDSIEEFVVYVSRTNLSLCTKIEPSIYETNLFLIDRDPTLIEYAAFFGSIQIIQYLKYNEVQLTGSLWLYAVHSNNPELIHFLEENEVNLSDSLPIHVLLESIKCHHNANTNYIKDNFDDKMQIRDRSSFNDIIFNSLNFLFYPDDIVSDACKMKDIKAFKSYAHH
ncbi:hypothetical protein M9Y10_018306 [Tritrichomonas musculus]|uniref:DUF3447 domain-containing protein n=1 Tax=Tritrichomonas musculus TaxID=1915356 RepID=A0ABR2HNJ9_9EUKA